MATITPLLDTRYKTKEGYPIRIRIIHGNKQRNISIGYRIAQTQFKDGAVVKHPDKDIINGVLSDKVNEAKRYFADCALQGVEPRLELIGTGYSSHSFIEYLHHRASQYKAKHQIIMDRKLRRFAKELKECFNRDVHFDDINADSLRTFEAWLIDQGNCSNTRHKKYKFLREYYAHAIEEGKAHAPNPFKGYKIPKEPVKKEKLTKEELSRIENIDLAPGPVNDARNLFLYSYYAKGSRFANCITLRPQQINNGRVYIQMNKGKKFISVKIHSRLRAILDKYKGETLVFPFLTDIPEGPEEFLKAIDSQNTIVNRNLKTLGALCEIKKKLTFHIARHTFAQHLKKNKTDIYTIQESMGHSDLRTTQIYMDSLGDESLDVEMERLYGK